MINIYKKSRNTYAMYLEIDDDTNMSRILPEHWRQSASILNNELDTPAFTYSVIYSENGEQVTTYQCANNNNNNTMISPELTPDQKWLMEKIKSWDNNKELVARSGATELGYHFCNETSIPMRSVITKDYWDTCQNGFKCKNPNCNSGIKVNKEWESCCMNCAHEDNLETQCIIPEPKEDDKLKIIGPSLLETCAEARNTKYDREIIGLCGTKVMVDVYRVSDAFPSKSPQVEHLKKKVLVTGDRGHKSTLQDLIDIRDSVNSAIVLHLQKHGE